MPETGVMPATGPRAWEGTVTLLAAPVDKAQNIASAGLDSTRVPAGLAALAGQFPGLRVEEMLSHDGKSLLAAGHAGDQAVIIKVLPEDDPSWRHRQRHEIGVYQIFARHPPPVRVPRLVHTDGRRIVVMERLEGATLGTGRYPRPLTCEEVAAAAALVGHLHGWQPLPDGFRPVFAYHQRIIRYHATGYFTGDDRRALERLLARCGQPRQLNHGDPLPGNMLRLLSGEWALLDWEFTGLFLPGFDLAMLSVLLAGTPGAADFLEGVAYQAGYGDAYLVNLAVVLSRERRIHLTLARDHPLRVARLPAIDNAWSRARERFRAAGGRRLFAGADRWTKPPAAGDNPGSGCRALPARSAKAASRPPGG
jgi:aminoglycoside phosphotransferase (APT) family kinase protein